MISALEDLKLDSLIVIYPGDRSFPLSDKIMAHPLKNYILSAQ